MSERIIFKTIFGSRLFGTNISSSDTDYKGIFIPSKRDLILQNKRDNIQSTTGDNKSKNSIGDVDVEMYSLKEFFKHIVNGQTNALDMLFSTDPDRYMSDEWREISDNKDKFLSSKMDSFIGYCLQQQAKYNFKIERYQEALRYLTFLKNQNQSMKLDEMLDKNPISRDVKDLIHVESLQVHKNGTMIDHISVCEKKVPVTIPVREAVKVYQKLCDDYGSRAKLAEKGAVDFKSLYHALRIAEEAKELLTTGHVTLPRPNAEYLKQIRRGEIDYYELSEKIVGLVEEIKIISSVLPKEPNYKWIENFIYKIYEQEIMRN